MNQIIYNPQIIDLGVSHKWASCNLGANSPEEFGNYFAWGEIESKSIYDCNNYKWFVDGISNKYGDIGEETILNTNSLKKLDLEDDAAHVMLKGTWRIPSLKDIDELYKQCDWIWTAMNGISGCRITSKVQGYTDSFIFIPAAGCICRSDKVNYGFSGFYWSNSIYKDNIHKAIMTTFDCNRRYRYMPCSRYIGLPIRPVCD
jgi:hypothetical protein